MLLFNGGVGWEGAPAWSSLSPSSRVMSGWMLCGGNTNKNITTEHLFMIFTNKNIIIRAVSGRMLCKGGQRGKGKKVKEGQW